MHQKLSIVTSCKFPGLELPLPPNIVALALRRGISAYSLWAGWLDRWLKHRLSLFQCKPIWISKRMRKVHFSWDTSNSERMIVISKGLVWDQKDLHKLDKCKMSVRSMLGWLKANCREERRSDHRIESCWAPLEDPVLPVKNRAIPDW